MSVLAQVWIERLKLFALFTKHSGFSEENEWRIVYMSERDPSKKFGSMIGYAINRNGVEPKLKLKVQPLDPSSNSDLSLEKIVDRIILGPSISTVLAREAVRRMLEKNGKPSLASKVVSSTIPFRP